MPKLIFRLPFFFVFSYFRVFVIKIRDSGFAVRRLWPLLGLVLLAGADAPPTWRPGPLLRLTRDGLEKERPGWAPRGRRLVCARHGAGGMPVWRCLAGT